MRTTILAVLAVAAVALGGCAGGRPAPGPSPTAQGGYPHLADGRRPEGMCMWAGSELRVCLHYAFGSCAVFGDMCSEATYEGMAPPAPPAMP